MNSSSLRAILALAGYAFSGAACLAQVASGAIDSADVHEWSSYGVPAVMPDRNGPLVDAVFLLVKQGGPWHEAESVRIGPAELKLLSLMQQKQWPQALDWLKQTQADVNARDWLGATALTLASLDGQLELVRELIRRGAELDRVGAGGWTPLGAAVFHGHELVVRDLIRKGARTDAPGATGQLPLHLACATGQSRMIQLLLDNGANWREFNRQGRHAMAEAALFGQVGAMQTLAATGVAYAEPDRYGLNALHAAALGEQKDTLAFLNQKGVPVTSPLTEILIDQVLHPIATP